MTDLKPKIFIGSSTLGYSIAEKVKNNLTHIGDCFLWRDSNVWDVNTSTFDNLIRMASYFDFGVFVATADDLTLMNDDIVIKARDNVVLEMALFLGSMGRNKSFLLIEEGTTLPSDFKGIYMPRFKSGSDKSILDACNECTSKITEHYKFGHLSLYPTTALAIGYYKNFVSRLVESIKQAENIEIDGIEYTNFKFQIVIPNDLSGLISEKAAHFYRRHNFKENAIRTPYRRHPVWFQIDSKNAPNAIIYDMPNTLTGIDDAIEMILQKNYHGRSAMQIMIEERELNNFRRVLQMQIDKSPFAKDIVEIVDEF